MHMSTIQTITFYVNITSKDKVVSCVKFRLSQNFLRWAGGQIHDFCLQNCHLMVKVEFVYISEAL